VTFIVTTLSLSLYVGGAVRGFHRAKVIKESGNAKGQEFYLKAGQFCLITGFKKWVSTSKQGFNKRL